MVDPISTIGAVASIIQLIDFTSRVIHRLDEYRAHTVEVPSIFRQITIELPVLKHTLRQLKEAYDSESVGADIEAAIVPALEECLIAIQSLDSTLKRVLPDAKDSWQRKQGKAFKSLFYDSDIETSIKRIRELLRSLTFASIPLRTFQDTSLAKLRTWVAGWPTPDPYTFHWKAKKRRLAGTGQWFLCCEEYLLWKKEANFSWLFGIPGCGKSVLSSGVIDDLEGHCQNDPDNVLAFFYFDFNDAHSQDPTVMIASVIKQLSSHCLKISEGVAKFYTSCDNGTRQPSPSACLDMLKMIIEEFSHVYIVLDALDECRDRKELLEILTTLSNWNLENLHVIVASRQERDIEEVLARLVSQRNFIRLKSSEVDKDIEAYVEHRLAHSKWKKDAALCQEIQKELSQKSRGMFRWASCQMDSLSRCLNKLQLRRSLKTLPRTLYETYERILLSIDEEHSQYALRMLDWLAFSSRPMYLDEIAEIVAIDPDREPGYHPDEKLEDPYDALTICGSLVAIISHPSTKEGQAMPYDDMDSATLSFTPDISFGEGKESTDDFISRKGARIVLSHFSVKEYLLSDRIRGSPASLYQLQDRRSHAAIARSCISYLRQFENRDDFQGVIELNAGLTKYTTMEWPYHAQSSHLNDQSNIKAITEFLSANNKIYSAWASSFVYEANRGDPGWCAPEPIYFASMFGLIAVVRTLIEVDPMCVNIYTKGFTTPLGIASECGKFEVMELLLKSGANVDFPNAEEAPLVLASAVGQTEAVKRIIAAGARKYFDKAILIAIKNAKVDSLKLLLQTMRGH
ncbi:hypothetical protein CC78DRAFT_583261 [Lojkania enalia]|uniref:NACHT domain-containing protein n=1 Tax=Lojkania enalia TaxID=147567 RepID=A0A9P4K7Z3_9PLEO|nr:hypothetical protein CC78DRAFT_583261 [Didymosphaeria enalia]